MVFFYDKLILLTINLYIFGRILVKTSLFSITSNEKAFLKHARYRVLLTVSITRKDIKLQREGDPLSKGRGNMFYVRFLLDDMLHYFIST